MTTRARTVLFSGALCIGAAVASAPAHAQARCDARANLTHNWQTPLSRTVTLHASDVTLRDALARLATAARIRISYSGEALPLERRVCIAYDAVAVGAALATLLDATNVHVVVAGNDHVVLAPRTPHAAPQQDSAPVLVVQHEPVVAATTMHDLQLAAPTNVMVIPGEDLARAGTRTMAQALNGVVPGVWLWAPSGSGLIAQYGSVRGASSFGGSAPKVYIDGIELANPLLLTRLAADAIERIEVIRGPQGAALYGADAIGGVTNIITRHELVAGGAPRLRVQSGFGVANSDFAAGAALAQDHAFSVRAGSLERSLGVNLSVGSLGEFAPDASARHIAGDAAARLIGARTTVTGTLRFLDDRAGSAVSTLVPDSSTRWLRLPGQTMAAFTDVQRVRQYTGGLSATFQQNVRWKHTFVAGVDAYSLDREAAAYTPTEHYTIPTTLPGSGALPGSQPIRFGSPPSTTTTTAPFQNDPTGGWRGTLRLTSVGGFEIGDVGSGSVTLSAEHSQLRQSEGSLTESRANTGITAQTEMGVWKHLFLTGGVRFEHDGGVTNAIRAAALPMLGGSLLTERGAVRMKLRAAYGKAIRWPQLPATQHARDPIRAAFRTLTLAPEQQSGVEGGFDVHVGRVLTLQLTRFDQTATGFTQQVGVAPSQLEGRQLAARSGYELQSVGQIDNRGWEMQASLAHGRLSLAGTAALVDSRVRSLSPGYSGDLRAGDRMLGVPARTASITAAWNGDQTFASITASRAADWINYDLLALAKADQTQAPSGALLRSYWRDYTGVTQLRATIARDVRRGLTLSLTGDNLLDVQLGEPDNITIVPGRTLSLGIRAAF